jgi:hypothetical protein
VSGANPNVSRQKRWESLLLISTYALRRPGFLLRHRLMAVLSAASGLPKPFGLSLALKA